MSVETGSSNKTVEIRIPLLNEGTDVLRPTQGRVLSADEVEVLPTPDYDPAIEEWEFLPGSRVRCEKEVRGGRELMVAREQSDSHGVITVSPEPVQVNLSPFGFQWYAKDFFEAYKKVKGGAPYSPARLTLLARALELAAKSLHVHQGRRDADLRKLGHNIVRACDNSILAAYGIALTADEVTELRKISDLNESKMFEYFWFRSPGYTPELGGVVHAITGRKGLPHEETLEGLLVRLLSPKM
jgi:hypothetical protein